MANPKRIKAPAQEVHIPQSQNEVAENIKHLGDLQRKFERESSYLNDEIGEATKKYQPVLESLDRGIKELQSGIQTWCEAHREELTMNGRVKTANLITGEVQWRQRPPSVKVRAQDMVIATLEKLGLGRFLRVKTEINKEAVLADPEAVSGIAGLSIATGIEDFVITPFEQTV